MNLGTLVVTLTMDSSQFYTNMHQATKAGKSFGNELSGTIDKLVKKVAGLTIFKKTAEGLANLSKLGMSYNAQMETYTTNFRVMLGSQEAAVEKVAELREMAAKTPFGMEDLAKGAQTLLSFGIESDKTTGILKMLGDISLGNKDKLGGLTLAFAQMSSAGKLTGQDLLQMINAGFNPLAVIAEKTGTSIGDLKEKMSGGKGSKEFQKQIKEAQKEVKKMGDGASTSAKMLAKMGKDGYISSDLIAQAFEMATSDGGQFFNGMEEGSKTLQGMLSTLKDGATDLLGKILKPFSEMLSDEIMPKALATVDALSAAWDEDGLAGLLGKAGEIISGYFGSFIAKAKEAGPKILAGLYESLTGDTENKAAVQDFFANLFDSTASAFQNGASFITDVVGALTNLSDWCGENSGIVNAALGAIATALLAINAPMTLVGVAVAVVIANWDALKAAAEELGTAIKTWVTDKLDALETTATNVKTAVENFFNVTVPETLKSAINSIASAWNSVATAVGNAIAKVKEFLGLDPGDTGVHVGPGGNTFGGTFGKPFATGLEYVPYNDFPARLHEGEAVLTKFQADNWRRGDRDSGRQTDLPPIVININAEGWEDKIYELERAVANGLERARWS